MATINEFVIEIIEEIALKTVDTWISWITTMDKNIPQLEYKELVQNTDGEDNDWRRCLKISGCG